jgi:hypothetical protein
VADTVPQREWPGIRSDDYVKETLLAMGWMFYVCKRSVADAGSQPHGANRSAPCNEVGSLKPSDARFVLTANNARSSYTLDVDTVVVAVATFGK